MPKLVLGTVFRYHLVALVPGDCGWWLSVHFAGQLDWFIGFTLHQQLFDGGRLSCGRNRTKKN